MKDKMTATVEIVRDITSVNFRKSENKSEILVYQYPVKGRHRQVYDDIYTRTFADYEKNFNGPIESITITIK